MKLKDILDITSIALLFLGSLLCSILGLLIIININSILFNENYKLYFSDYKSQYNLIYDVFSYNSDKSLKKSETMLDAISKNTDNISDVSQVFFTKYAEYKSCYIDANELVKYYNYISNYFKENTKLFKTDYINNALLVKLSTLKSVNCEGYPKNSLISNINSGYLFYVSYKNYFGKNSFFNIISSDSSCEFSFKECFYNNYYKTCIHNNIECPVTFITDNSLVFSEYDYNFYSELNDLKKDFLKNLKTKELNENTNNIEIEFKKYVLSKKEFQFNEINLIDNSSTTKLFISSKVSGNPIVDIKGSIKNNDCRLNYIINSDIYYFNVKEIIYIDKLSNKSKKDVNFSFINNLSCEFYDSIKELALDNDGNVYFDLQDLKNLYVDHIINSLKIKQDNNTHSYYDNRYVNLFELEKVLNSNSGLNYNSYVDFGFNNIYNFIKNNLNITFEQNMTVYYTDNNKDYTYLEENYNINNINYYTKLSVRKLIYNKSQECMINIYKIYSMYDILDIAQLRINLLRFLSWSVAELIYIAIFNGYFKVLYIMNKDNIVMSNNKKITQQTLNSAYLENSSISLLLHYFIIIIRSFSVSVSYFVYLYNKDLPNDVKFYSKCVSDELSYIVMESIHDNFNNIKNLTFVVLCICIITISFDFVLRIYIGFYNLFIKSKLD